jgi:hypothetical protein
MAAARGILLAQAVRSVPKGRTVVAKCRVHDIGGCPRCGDLSPPPGLMTSRVRATEEQPPKPRQPTNFSKSKKRSWMPASNQPPTVSQNNNPILLRTRQLTFLPVRKKDQDFGSQHPTPSSQHVQGQPFLPAFSPGANTKATQPERPKRSCSARSLLRTLM